MEAFIMKLIGKKFKIDNSYNSLIYIFKEAKDNKNINVHLYSNEFGANRDWDINTVSNLIREGTWLLSSKTIKLYKHLL
jgi:hypothetical protein